MPPWDPRRRWIGKEGERPRAHVSWARRAARLAAVAAHVVARAHVGPAHSAPPSQRLPPQCPDPVSRATGRRGQFDGRRARALAPTGGAKGAHTCSFGSSHSSREEPKELALRKLTTMHVAPSWLHVVARPGRSRDGAASLERVCGAAHARTHSPGLCCRSGGGNRAERRWVRSACGCGKSAVRRGDEDQRAPVCSHADERSDSTGPRLASVKPS